MMKPRQSSEKKKIHVFHRPDWHRERSLRGPGVFSLVTVTCKAEVRSAEMTPLAVLPADQHSKIGGALVKAGLPARRAILQPGKGLEAAPHEERDVVHYHAAFDGHQGY